MFLIALLVVLAIGLALGAYALFAPRRVAAEPVVAQANVGTSAPVQLTEAERIDAVFAMGALDGDESTRRLALALDDPSETVALAAAHALAGSGRGELVRSYVAAHPGERTTRLGETLDWMHEDSRYSGI
jgi:hypothetical protein